MSWLTFEPLPVAPSTAFPGLEVPVPIPGWYRTTCGTPSENGRIQRERRETLVKGVGNVSLFHVPSKHTIILFGFRPCCGCVARDPGSVIISRELSKGPAWLDCSAVGCLYESILILLQDYNFPNENSVLSFGPRGLN